MGRNVGHLERQSRRPPADNNKKDTRRVKRKHKHKWSAVHVIPAQAQAETSGAIQFTTIGKKAEKGAPGVCVTFFFALKTCCWCRHL